MLQWALIFAVIAVVAAVLGFGGIAGAAVWFLNPRVLANKDRAAVLEAAARNNARSIAAAIMR